MPPPKLKAPDLRAMQDEFDFWDAHQREFATKYPNEFVAVHQHRVIATAQSLQELVDRTDRLGIPRIEVWVRRFDVPPKMYVL